MGYEKERRERCRTECSSCLTSNTVPSLNVHLMTSVSGLAPLTSSALERADQKVGKEGSLMRCQTWEREAEITADSDTEVEVGIAVDDMLEFCCCVCDLVCGGWLLAVEVK